MATKGKRRLTHADHKALGSWVFGFLLLIFFVGVFVFAPATLPEFKQRMLAISSGVLTALLGYFMMGKLGVEVQSVETRFGTVVVHATGGIALGLIVLILWWTPFAPVGIEELRHSVEDIKQDTKDAIKTLNDLKELLAVTKELELKLTASQKAKGAVLIELSQAAELSEWLARESEDPKTTELRDKIRRVYARLKNEKFPEEMKELVDRSRSIANSVVMRLTIRYERAFGVANVIKAVAKNDKGTLLGEATFVGIEPLGKGANAFLKIVKEVHFRPTGKGREAVFKGKLYFNALGKLVREEEIQGKKRFALFSTWPR